MFELKVESTDTIALLAFGKALTEMGNIAASVPTVIEVPAPVMPTESLVVESPVTPQPDAFADYNDAVTEEDDPEDAFNPSAPEGVTLDARGFPHDTRIHGKNKSLNQDGTWRYRRCPANQTKEDWEMYVNGVETELKQLMAIQPAPVVEAPVTPPVVEAPVTPPVVEAPATVTPPVVEAPATVTPPVVETPAAVTFADFMKLCTSQKKVGTERIKEIVASQGIAGIPLLNTRPDLIPQCYALVKAEIDAK